MDICIGIIDLFEVKLYEWNCASCFKKMKNCTNEAHIIYSFILKQFDKIPIGWDLFSILEVCMMNDASHDILDLRKRVPKVG